MSTLNFRTDKQLTLDKSDLPACVKQKTLCREIGQELTLLLRCYVELERSIELKEPSISSCIRLEPYARNIKKISTSFR